MPSEGKEAQMTWIRLLENGVPVGEVAEDVEFSSPPAVGDRILVHTSEGEMIVFEVLGRTFEIVVDEGGQMTSDERVTLHVERLKLVSDDEEKTSVQRH
jgi:hypothetical protein